MFSGIVERVGTVERADREERGLRLTIAAGSPDEPLTGASVSVNGVCLTVERAREGRFESVAVPEKLRAAIA